MEKADILECFVFSDHGMSPVHGGVDLIPEIESAVGANGKNYLAFYDSTMARFWCDDDRVRARIEGILERRADGRIIPSPELVELGVAFPDRSQGDLIYVLQEGLIILPSYMGDAMLAGMHGYHPDASWADASILGLRCPSSVQPRHIADIHTLMSRTADRLLEERA